MGVVDEIEDKLARLREKESGDGAPVLRTSTMTHLVWAPPAWLPQARATLAGLRDRHPARTILLVPETRRATDITAKVALYAIEMEGSRDAYAEVVEVGLHGDAIAHPASIVLPLLVSDLPVFCRWRGEPEWDSPQLGELLSVVDRLVVNSSEWKGLPAAYEQLTGLFDRVAVSDIAFSRTVGWRARLSERWPRIKTIGKLSVEGPRADALLLAGWLRSRLRRDDVALSWRSADEVVSVRVDRDPVEPPVGDGESGPDLLSNELDVFGRDPVYEGAVRSAIS
jgi:glucose-6-phosphate dehydrogenase assembly protein OpcA